MAWPFTRSRPRASGSRGPVVRPNAIPASAVYSDSEYGGQVGGSFRPTGPGAGWNWGAGPKWFVPWSRGPETVVEIGREGDFVPGGDGSPQDGDLGFPSSSRWPGYPNNPWKSPLYEAGGAYGGFAGGTMLAGRVSTVFTCQDLISRTLATMDMTVTQSSSPIVGPSWLENPEPAIYVSMVDAMKCVVNSLLARGNAYVACTARYANGQVARWVVLNPDTVEVQIASGLPTYWVNGVEVSRKDLLHLKYQLCPGDPYGISPLEAVWRNLMSADALERWGTELAVGGGIPTAILKTQAKVTGPQAKELKQSWVEAAQSRGVYPVILSNGLDYQPLNLKPTDIGLLDLRKFDEARIAAAYGVPLWLIGLPMETGSSMTYTNVQSTFDFFWRATLRAIGYNITMGLSGWALPRGQWLRLNSESLVRPGILERSQAYLNLIKATVLTPAEARVFENLAPVPPAPPDDNTIVDITNTLAVTTEGGV